MTIKKRSLFQSMKNIAYTSSRGNSNSFCRTQGGCLRYHFFNRIALLPSLAQKNYNFYDSWEEKKFKDFSFSDKEMPGRVNTKKLRWCKKLRLSCYWKVTPILSLAHSWWLQWATSLTRWLSLLLGHVWPNTFTGMAASQEGKNTSVNSAI